MKRLLVIAFLLMVALSQAQTIVYFGSTDNIGTSRTNLNANFSNLLPVAQAAYSNTHVVTHQASETNFLQWVSRSSDGKTNYWLACFTNGAAGAAATPQGPWTNWIAAATFGVSNAGTFNMASSNIVLITLGTNLLTIQGTASEPTNVAWNGNSLWNVGGGAIGMGPTNVIAGSFTQIYYTAGFKFMSTGEIAWLENVASAGSVGIFSNGNFVANSTNINFVGSGVGAITGNTVNISGGGGGGYVGLGYEARYTVTADVQSVSIPVVSQTNRHLIVEVVGRDAGNNGAYLLYLNGDTANKYDRTEFYVSGTSASLAGGTALGQSGIYIFVDASASATQNFGRATCKIFDYTNSARFKLCSVNSDQMRDNTSNTRYYDYHSVRYTNTPAAVTGLYFVGYNSNIVAGTTFTTRWED